MKTRWILILIMLLAGGLVGSRPADAAVVVLDNQAAGKVEFAVRESDGRQTRHTLVPGEVTPIAVTSPIGITFDAQGQVRRYLLDANNIYCFVERDQKLDLSELELPGSDGASPKATKPPQSGKLATLPEAPHSAYTIPVKILVDDEEPRVRALWEKQLRGRLAAASDIFERHCRVRFQVVAVDTWVTDKGTHDFNQSVAEFEHRVRPAPARIAIGFTGRYEWAAGETHLGVIRGPLRSHILIRGSLVRISEPEQLEILVHELGHFLGAVHSAEETSVMRPKLGDRQSCVRSFRIGFDASNTLAMYLLVEEPQPSDSSFVRVVAGNEGFAAASLRFAGQGVAR